MPVFGLEIRRGTHKIRGKVGRKIKAKIFLKIFKKGVDNIIDDCYTVQAHAKQRRASTLKTV